MLRLRRAGGTGNPLALAQRVKASNGNARCRFSSKRHAGARRSGHRGRADARCRCRPRGSVARRRECRVKPCLTEKSATWKIPANIAQDSADFYSRIFGAQPRGGTFW